MMCIDDYDDMEEGRRKEKEKEKYTGGEEWRMQLLLSFGLRITILSMRLIHGVWYAFLAN